MTTFKSRFQVFFENSWVDTIFPILIWFVFIDFQYLFLNQRKNVFKKKNNYAHV